MPTIILPAARSIIESQPFSREPVEHMLDELCTPGHEFTGYVRIESGNQVYLLFLYNSRPYAAGIIEGDLPRTISIRAFFREVGRIDEKNALISIHATDPVLLKSLLVFVQNTPLLKAPAEFIDIDATIKQIGQDATDALIVLNRQHKLDFWFFKNGSRTMSYTAGPSTPETWDIPAAVQIRALLDRSADQTDCMIYRDTATTEDADSMVISQQEMLDLLRGNQAVAGSRKHLLLNVLEGPQKGEKLSGPIPCVLGRKDTDITVSDPLVSKRHAAIQMVNGKLIIIDLNSTNGTFLNGKQVKQHEITIGDDLLLGSTMMKIELLSPP